MSATAVKAGFRGMKGRRYFESVKINLQIMKEQREARTNASALYHEGKLHEAIAVIDKVDKKNMIYSLYFMKSQFYYHMRDWKNCEISARNASGLNFEPLCFFFLFFL